MRIGVLSDCRVPTRPVGGHGLGRLAVDLANGLQTRGHAVTLYGGPGSQWAGALVIHANETERANQLAPNDADVWLDLSHYHDVSRVHPEWKVVNYLTDIEFRGLPPCAAIATPTDAQKYPQTRVLPLGVDVDALPLVTDKEPYLAFAAKIHPAKGYQVAIEVHCRQPIPVRFVGERMTQDPLPDWRPGLIGHEFYQFLGKATGLLAPTLIGIGGRVPLEAAACGTPTLVLDNNSVADHVEHGLTGFVCQNAEEMADAVQDLPSLKPERMREWAHTYHSLALMARVAEMLLYAVADGERW